MQGNHQWAVTIHPESRRAHTLSQPFLPPRHRDLPQQTLSHLLVPYYFSFFLKVSLQMNIYAPTNTLKVFSLHQFCGPLF